MENYNIIKGITALADEEIKDEEYSLEINRQLDSSPVNRFYFEVQTIISKQLKRALIKHPVPFDLRKKLLQLLSSAQI
jgi:hypothetical protein